MFLTILKNRVIDVAGVGAVAAVAGVAAVPEVPEIRDAQDNITQAFVAAVPAVEAVAAVAEVTEVAHFEFQRMYLDDDVKNMALQIERGDHTDFYKVEMNGVTPSLVPAALKTGPRRAAPAREVVEIEAGGKVVGSTIRDA